MKTSRGFLIYLLLIHVFFFGLALGFYRQSPILIVTIELGLVLSFSLGIYLLRSLTQTTVLTRQFRDLLQDGNYSARLKNKARGEVGELLELFNRMLETLYQERLQVGEQRGFLDRLLEATPSAVIVFDFDGRVSLLNSSARELLGQGLVGEKALGSSLLDFVQTSEKNLPLNAQFWRDLNALEIGASVVLSDDNGRRFSCQRGQFTDRGFARDFLLIDEITLAIASSEKSTYDKLVRVLAHEVNNTVAVTVSVLDSLLFYQRQIRSEDQEDFTTAIAAVQRRNANLAQFIERFTDVVKMPEPHLHMTNVTELLEGIVLLMRQTCQEAGIELRWLKKETQVVLALDAHLMEQALLNILKNAIEAVLASQKQVASLDSTQSTRNHYVHLFLGRDGGGDTAQNPTENLRLSIIDSANGLMDVEHAQLFSPFFTTKKGGQGIGLMFVREVLQRHGLQYRFAPNGHAETQFDIYF